MYIYIFTCDIFLSQIKVYGIAKYDIVLAVAIINFTKITDVASYTKSIVLIIASYVTII